jgi:hypothetical protein
MTPPTTTDDLLETEILATLHCHTGDVQPQAPRWQELIERPETVVVSPYSGSAIKARGRAWPSWSRPVLAAAAALAVVAAGAVLVDGSPSQRIDSAEEGQATDPLTSQPPLTTPLIPAPGEQGFDLGASAVYPLDGDLLEPEDRTDPQRLTIAYLHDRLGVPDQSLEVGEAQVTPSPTPDDVNTGPTATVPWTTSDPSTGKVMSRGTAFLFVYNSDVGMVWSVGGAATDGLGLTEVRRDSTRLSFAIGHQGDPNGQDVALSIIACGGPEETCGTPDGATATPDQGESVSVEGGRMISDDVWLVDVPAGERLTVTAPVEDQSDVTVAVGYVVDGEWQSITEMAPPHDTGATCDQACGDPD